MLAIDQNKVYIVSRRLSDLLTWAQDGILFAVMQNLFSENDSSWKFVSTGQFVYFTQIIQSQKMNVVLHVKFKFRTQR